MGQALLYGWVSKYRDTNPFHNIKNNFTDTEKYLQLFYSHFFPACGKGRYENSFITKAISFSLFIFKNMIG